MNRDLIHKIILKLDAIHSTAPNEITFASIEARLDQLIEATKHQNEIYELMVKTLNSINSKSLSNSGINTSVIEEKLDSIWEILYETKNNLNS